MLQVLKAFVGGKNNAFIDCISITILNCDSEGMHVNSENHGRPAHSLLIIAMAEQSHVETHWQVQRLFQNSEFWIKEKFIVWAESKSYGAFYIRLCLHYLR